MPGLPSTPQPDKVNAPSPQDQPATPDDQSPREGYPQRMLRDLRDLLAVVDRRLVQLREYGTPEVVAHMEDLRDRTANLIQRLEAERPSSISNSQRAT
jgi:hypothetical protein